MLQLISLSLQSEDVTPLFEIPKELMTRPEREIVDWIVDFYSKYGKMPIISQVQKEFPFWAPLEFAPEELKRISIPSVVDEVKKDRLLVMWAAKLQEALIMARDERVIPEKLINEAQHIMAASNGISRFSVFDRTKYFREPGLPLGIRMIDRVTGGLGKSEFMTIAGRLGTGKTTIALFIAAHWWSLGKRILFISNEMLDADIYSRLDGIVGKFNPLELRTESGEEIRVRALSVGKDVKSACAAFGGEIYIPSRSVKTPSEVFALARNLMVDAVLIDGLYLMQPDGGHFTAKWERVAEVSNQIKAQALNFNLPVLAMTQYKRMSGKKSDFDPEDIAYSDAIGQDSDFILSLNPSSAIKGKYELSLIKNRFGPESSTIVRVDYDTMTMTEETVSPEFLTTGFGMDKEEAKPETEELPEDEEAGTWVTTTKDPEPEPFVETAKGKVLLWED